MLHRALYRQAFKETEIAPFRGWQSAKEIFTPYLSEFLTDKEVPPAVLMAYNALKTSLKGLHSVFVQLGDSAFHLTANNLDLVTYLPTQKELGIAEF